MTAPSIASRAKALWQAIPLKLMLVLAPLSLWLGEWYPFSDFPMYHWLGRHYRIVYVTGEDDRMLPVVPKFRVMGINLQKMFRSRERRLRQELGPDAPEGEVGRRAAQLVLEHLLERRERLVDAPLEATELKLWKKVVRLEDREFQETTEFLASVPVP